MNALEVKRISKSFGGNRVLTDVSFSLGEGEVVGIVGPNGSGKTTLLNVLSGVVRHDTGRILFYGKDISGLKPSARAKLGIGRTFQITRLFQNLTVYENVLVPSVYGSERCSFSDIKRILELVGIWKLKDQKAGTLSLAQRKRLELARALIMKPRLLLLDEVFAGLNPTSTLEILDLLSGIHRDLRVSMIFVEHVLKALFKVSNRVLVLSEGKIIYDGKPEGMSKNELVIKAYLGERYAR